MPHADASRWRGFRVAAALCLAWLGVAVLWPAEERMAQDPPNSPTSPAAASQQIIIKLRASAPALPHDLRELSQLAGATLVYVRPMSLGAHVIRVQQPVDGAEFARIIERLRTSADVDYAEADLTMQHTGSSAQ